MKTKKNALSVGNIMNFYYKPLTLREFLTRLFYTEIFCILITSFFIFVGGWGAAKSFIVCHITGYAVFFCIRISIHIAKTTNRIIQLMVISNGLIIGIVIGLALGFIAIGFDLSIFFKAKFIVRIFILTALFGTVITYFFYSRDNIISKETSIKEERIKRLNMEKRSVETNLRLLQAQIEPHFLFNTLSNILSLLSTDLQKGKSMLRDLIQYLRTTLSKTRDEITTIGGEMEIIRAYLNIFKIRMGNRLRYNIDIPDNIKDVPFHPMLIQPLVENAIKHGLEPDIKGGEIRILGAIDGDTLRLEVIDTGARLYENSNHGMGINNIGERLKSLYGEKGRLILEENRPSGVKAIIEVPYEQYANK